MNCKFIKHFDEPNQKYNCLSTSLFFIDKYIKVTKNVKIVNKTEDKVNIFYRNLVETEKRLTNGYYPEDLYLRLYFDKTVYKIDKYVQLFKKFKQNRKIQLVEFNCDNFKTNPDSHIGLFGTLIRFYSIFDTASINMSYCILLDADNILTNNFFELFDKFKKSRKLIYTFNKVTQTGFHSNDYMTNNNLFNYIYLLGCLTIIKRNKIFDIKYWNKYFVNMYKQNDLMYVFNYNDFKRFAINSVLNKQSLKLQSYYSHHYGSDEIWINYVLKKILIDNEKKNKIDVYITKDYSFTILLNRLLDLFIYNSIVNIEMFKLFINNCTFLKNKNLEALSKLIKKLDNDKNEKNILKFFSLLKKNMYFDHIYIQSNIKFTIFNAKSLINVRGKYRYFDITGSLTI